MEALRSSALMQPWHLTVFLGLLVPLTLLWALCLLDCLRRGLRADLSLSAARAPADPAQPLDAWSWLLLLLLSGWFGALAYLFTLLLPRLLGALRAGMPRLGPLQIGHHAPQS